METYTYIHYITVQFIASHYITFAYPYTYLHTYVHKHTVNQSIKANQIKANQNKSNQSIHIYIWTHLPINLRIHRKEKLCRETKISVYARNSSITNETFHFLENEWYSNMYTIYIHKCMHAYITLHYIRFHYITFHYITYTTLVNIIWICIYIYMYIFI